MNSDEKKPAQGSAELPEIVWPACGAFCDIFWWARRKPQNSDSPGDSSSRES